MSLNLTRKIKLAIVSEQAFINFSKTFEKGDHELTTTKINHFVVTEKSIFYCPIADKLRAVMKVML